MQCGLWVILYVILILWFYLKIIFFIYSLFDDEVFGFVIWFNFLISSMEPETIISNAVFAGITCYKLFIHSVYLIWWFDGLLWLFDFMIRWWDFWCDDQSMKSTLTIISNAVLMDQLILLVCPAQLLIKRHKIFMKYLWLFQKTNDQCFQNIIPTDQSFYL